MNVLATPERGATADRPARLCFWAPAMMAAITLTNLQLMAAPQQGAPLLAPLKVDLTDPNLQPGDDAPEWAYDAAQDTFPRWMRARAVTIHWVGLHLERQHALADGWRDAWRMCVMPAVLPYL